MLFRVPSSAKVERLAPRELQCASWVVRKARAPLAFFDAKKMRQRWLAQLTESLDETMRTRVFLEGLRGVVTTATYTQLIWSGKAARIALHHLTHATATAGATTP